MTLQAPKLIDVELRADLPHRDGHHTVFVSLESGGTLAVVFLDGKTRVLPEVADALKGLHVLSK